MPLTTLELIHKHLQEYLAELEKITNTCKSSPGGQARNLYHNALPEIQIALQDIIVRSTDMKLVLENSNAVVIRYPLSDPASIDHFRAIYYIQQGNKENRYILEEARINFNRNHNLPSDQPVDYRLREIATLTEIYQHFNKAIDNAALRDIWNRDHGTPNYTPQRPQFESIKNAFKIDIPPKPIRMKSNTSYAVRPVKPDPVKKIKRLLHGTMY